VQEDGWYRVKELRYGVGFFYPEIMDLKL